MTLKSASTQLICPNPKCKKDINKPILLTDLSGTPTESYYACPRCMTKLGLISETQEGSDVTPISAQKTAEEKEEKPEEVVEPQKPEEVVEPQKPEEVVEPQKPEEKPVKPSESKQETPPECSHSFGYLSKRPKNAAIPEECLTCQKMIKCMLEL